MSAMLSVLEAEISNSALGIPIQGQAIKITDHANVHGTI